MRYNISGYKCGKRIRKRLAMNNIKELLNYQKLNYILHGGLCVCTRTCCIRESKPALFYERSVPSNYIREKLRCYYHQGSLGGCWRTGARTPVVYTDIANETSAAFSSDKYPCLEQVASIYKELRWLAIAIQPFLRNLGQFSRRGRLGYTQTHRGLVTVSMNDNWSIKIALLGFSR